jgi:hypothetical protein
MKIKSHPLEHGHHEAVVDHMAGLRVRRTWWIMAQGTEPPLFRVLARKWRSVDRRERRMTPFQMALPGADTPTQSRNSFGPRNPKRLSLMAELIKKSKRTWNPWMMTK